MPRPLGILRRPAAIGLGLLLTAFVAWAAADWYRTVPDDALQHARYVGREACIACHQLSAATNRPSVGASGSSSRRVACASPRVTPWVTMATGMPRAAARRTNR